MEIAKALYFMRSRQFDQAIETLKSYEKKDKQLALVAQAAPPMRHLSPHVLVHRPPIVTSTRASSRTPSSTPTSR